MAFHSDYDDWRLAEAAAHAADRQAFAEAMSFLEGRGPAPSPEQWEECKRLRAHANALFDRISDRWKAVAVTRGAAPAPRTRILFLPIPLGTAAAYPA